MTLADNYGAQQPGPGLTARTEWDGSSGFIQTGAEGADFNPENFADILERFGFDADRVQIMGNTRVSRWQRFDGEWLSAYRFHLAPRLEAIDLPALYAEVARTKAKPQLKPRAGDATVVVCWADVQVGKVDELGGIRELLERLDEKRENLHAYLRRSHFDHIVVADCGDIIEGFSNFPAQYRTNALSLMDQVDVAAVEFWKTIRLCERHAPVDVLSCPSNHCAWRREGKNLAGKTTDDWGLHINKRLERHNEEVGLRVAFHRPEDWCETLQFDIRGTRLGLAHGHQVSSPDQIKTWWAKMTHAGVLNCDVLLTGHFHFASLRPSGRTQLRYGEHPSRPKWHIQAPTLDNGSSWVRNKYGEDGDPALCVFQINAEGFDTGGFALL
jgi:hypothetical protein